MRTLVLLRSRSARIIYISNRIVIGNGGANTVRAENDRMLA